MSPLDPLFACTAVILITSLGAERPGARIGPWLGIGIRGSVRLAVILVLVGTGRNWLAIVATLAAIAALERFGRQLATRAPKRIFAIRLIASVTRLLLIFAVFGHPALVSAFSPTTESVVAFVSRRNLIFATISPEQLHRALVHLVGVLLAGFEANHVVAFVLDRVGLIPRLEEDESGATAPDEPEIRRGRLIGILERSLALVLTMSQHLPALGILVAAKALTRFKELDDRPFAEYVLIGTLLSISMAVAIALLLSTM